MRGLARAHRPRLRSEHSAAPHGIYALFWQKRRIPRWRRDGCLTKAPYRRDRSDDRRQRLRPPPLTRVRDEQPSPLSSRKAISIGSTIAGLILRSPDLALDKCICRERKFRDWPAARRDKCKARRHPRAQVAPKHLDSDTA